MKKIRTVIILALFVTGCVQAAERYWIKDGNGSWGTGTYWDGGVVPANDDDAIFTNAVTGYVNLNGDTAVTVNKIRVANPDNAAVRLFRNTGSASQAVKFCEFAKGRVTLTNTTLSSAASGQTTSVGLLTGETAWLTLSGTAVIALTNSSALYIGNASNACGVVTVKDTATLTVSKKDATVGLSVGQASDSIGSLVQKGGTVQGYGRTFVGYNASYGAYELSGGTLELLYSGANTRYRIGAGTGATGLFYQRGGTFNIGVNDSANGRTFELCGGNENAVGILYAAGGTARFRQQVELLSGAIAAGKPSYAELTVEGSSVVRVDDYLALRSTSSNTGKGTSAVNINRGGTLQVEDLKLGYDSGAASYLNGDGGILWITQAQTDLLSTMTPIILYGGGLALSNTVAVTVTGTWRAPGGWGVSNCVLSAGGSDYLAPPRVLLSGGSGSNATPVAFIDYDAGAVTGVAVTCRGEGFAETDTLTVSFSGGGGSNATATATLAANQAGPFMKRGAGVTTFSGNKSYPNETIVQGGTLLVNGTNTDGGTFTVTSGAVLGGTGTIAPKAGASVVVNGSLEPGAVGACGTLTLGSAAQATSLTLNRDLTADITLTSNDCVAVYGDVSFGAGATVTVSASDSSVWTSRAAKIPLLTYTGTLSGTPQRALPPEASAWALIVREDEKTLYLGHRPGMLIRVH